MAVRATYTREDFRYNHNRHVQGFWGKFKFKITPTTTTSEFFFFKVHVENVDCRNSFGMTDTQTLKNPETSERKGLLSLIDAEPNYTEVHMLGSTTASLGASITTRPHFYQFYWVYRYCKKFHVPIIKLQASKKKHLK